MNARGISERVSRGVEVRAPLEKGFLQQVRDQGGLFLPDRKPECLTAKAKSNARASMCMSIVWPPRFTFAGAGSDRVGCVRFGGMVVEEAGLHSHPGRASALWRPRSRLARKGLGRYKKEPRRQPSVTTFSGKRWFRASPL